MTNEGSGARSADYVFLIAPPEEGGGVYRAPAEVHETLLGFEREFASRAGCPLIFADVAEHRLTPFAVRLFRKGYVSLRPNEREPRVMDITAVQPEIERRLAKILGLDETAATAADGILVTESDLPFEGPIAAAPEGMMGAGRVRLFGVRPGDNPVEVLENILYGHTGKDDPESSHHGEHEISEGVDRE